MLRREAEHEADRRNREDPDRERYEFYAFDESAGIAEDAWDVAARLRQGTSAGTPATAAAAARRAAVAPEEAPVYEETAPYGEAAVHEQPPVYDEPAYPDPEPPEYAEAPAAEPARRRERAERPRRERVGLPRRPRAPLRRRPRAEPKVEEDRAGVLVRTIGAVVVVVGMLWMAMVVALAVFLRPEDATSFAVYLGAAVLGLAAIALGVAIRRS